MEVSLPGTVAVLEAVLTRACELTAALAEGTSDGATPGRKWRACLGKDGATRSTPDADEVLAFLFDRFLGRNC